MEEKDFRCLSDFFSFPFLPFLFLIWRKKTFAALLVFPFPFLLFPFLLWWKKSFAACLPFPFPFLPFPLPSMEEEDFSACLGCPFPFYPLYVGRRLSLYVRRRLWQPIFPLCLSSVLCLPFAPSVSLPFSPPQCQHVPSIALNTWMQPSVRPR